MRVLITWKITKERYLHNHWLPCVQERRELVMSALDAIAKHENLSLLLIEGGPLLIVGPDSFSHGTSHANICRRKLWLLIIFRYDHYHVHNPSSPSLTLYLRWVWYERESDWCVEEIRGREKKGKRKNTIQQFQQAAQCWLVFYGRRKRERWIGGTRWKKGSFVILNILKSGHVGFNHRRGPVIRTP